MQSLVIGATGIVGGYIVDQLRRDGEEPLALSRQPRQSTGVTWLTGDLASPEPLNCPPFDVLYCTAGIALLVAALPKFDLTSIKRVVAFTSTSIVTKQNSPIESERETVRAWAEAEQQLMLACETASIGCTILRPTIIYAEGRDRNVTRLAGLIRKFGILPLMGNGAGLRQPVHAEDLAIGAIDCAASTAAIGGIYALPGGETISYSEMVGRIFDGLLKPRRIVPTPPWLWHAAFTLAKPLFPNANVAMGVRMAKDMVFDPSPAIRDFGWSPRSFRPQFGKST
jgi:nucleoside-diphosphate-sugar epimerase